VRRALNVLVAALILGAVLPVMLLIALLIKLTSPGPVIFRQLRVGLDRRQRLEGSGPVKQGYPEEAEPRAGPTGLVGESERWAQRGDDAGGRLFFMLKFRTMIVQPEGSEQVWASEGDPRITPLGHFLRKYRLDELPQLVNVLADDMNIVGPRPEQPRIFHDLRGKITEYPVRQCVRPGITGLAQVNHGYDRSLDDVRQKLLYDIKYVEDRSPLVDLQIMARTVPVMLFRVGSL
jgi:lipopolysaccharide/colanic/teichoic acid biosynthesis glycosyltransferase